MISDKMKKKIEFLVYTFHSTIINSNELREYINLLLENMIFEKSIILNSSELNS